MHSVANSTVPRISGTSAVTIESTASLPIPGHEKIRSTTTTPPRKKPRSRPTWMRTGTKAFRKACRHRTDRLPTPLACAVRM